MFAYLVSIVQFYIVDILIIPIISGGILVANLTGRDKILPGGEQEF